MIIWFCGAAGSGKSTLSRELNQILERSVVLDGDEVRRWLTPDCGFSVEDRRRHVNRVSHVAKLLSSVGGYVIVALVRPPEEPVDFLIHLVGRARCEPWPGTTWPVPDHPRLVLNTGLLTKAECIAQSLALVRSHPM
jgi:adenylylsulfate kinase-like enzyme